jgi:hypothetical protein
MSPMEFYSASLPHGSLMDFVMYLGLPVFILYTSWLALLAILNAPPRSPKPPKPAVNPPAMPH